MPRLYQSLLLPLSIAIALPLSGSALADQTDPRLASLFDTLQQTDDRFIIRTTENQIWGLWLQHENPDVERLMELATRRMNAGDYPDALVAFNQIIENFPDYAEAWNKRATLYYAAGNFEASIADIEKTLALEPRHFGALSGLGMVYIQQKELAKAKQAFEDLVRVHPNSTNARENLEIVTEQLEFSVI